jgi:hypothetical protein
MSIRLRRRAFIAGLGGAAAWPLVACTRQDDRVQALQMRVLRLQAEGAADKISNFIKGIESQVGWTTQLPWSASTRDQRRFDGMRLLRQVPAISELVHLDPTGKEEPPLTRVGLPPTWGTDINNDYSHEFTEAVAKKVYYGPVYFRQESEPYMTLSLAGARLDAGVSVAEVNLKLIWDVVTQMNVGERGQAYVVDGQGRLIVHRDISLVLGRTDMTQLAQVRAARTDGAGASGEAKDIHGRDVLTAYAPVAPLGWLVFVEMPIEEAK